MRNNIQTIIQEKQERKIYSDRVVELVKEQFGFQDAKKTVASENATAGTVYSFLASKLNEKMSYKFVRKIKHILITRCAVIYTSHYGKIWLKGIKQLDEDREMVDKLNADHYRYRKAYRERQRQFANKRYTSK